LPFGRSPVHTSNRSRVGGELRQDNASQSRPVPWSIMASVVVIGSGNVDLVVRAPRHPVPGETILGSSFATHPGGKGANQAVAAGRAGASVAMIGRFGADSGAELLRSELQGAGVDLDAVGTCRHDPTGTALITVSDAGENTIVVVPGANALIRPVHVDDAVAAGVFNDSAVALAQLEIPVDVVLGAFAAAHAVGARTILNAAPADSFVPALLDVTDVLVVNETEMAAVAGCGIDDPDLWARVGSVEAVVLTLGADGVVISTRAGERTAIAGQRVTVVDTTAAGDTFCGYLAASLARGRTLVGAATVANAAAAIACTREGAQPSIPLAVEVAAAVAGIRT
jgi:ribokinase